MQGLTMITRYACISDIYWDMRCQNVSLYRCVVFMISADKKQERRFIGLCLTNSRVVQPLSVRFSFRFRSYIEGLFLRSKIWFFINFDL